jgi:hypothetical protein
LALLTDVWKFQFIRLPQTLLYSFCEGLCAEQNDDSYLLTFNGDIAVVCSKLSQNSQHKTSLAKQRVPSRAAERQRQL